MTHVPLKTTRFIAALMKGLVGAIITTLAASGAHAAFTACTYETVACDRFGNHFHCVIVGWTGPDTQDYCSRKDQSTGPGRHPEPTFPVPDSCAQECGRTCETPPVFCGGW